MRASIELAERKLGRSVREEVPLPAYGEHLWEWYLQLARVSDAPGYADIYAWSSLSGVIVRPEEVEILLQMLATRREWWDKRRSSEKNENA